MSVSITLDRADYTSAPITSQHLGANVVFTKDFLDPGGPFDRYLNEMHSGFLRFPGGTVTEETFAPGGRDAERLFSMTRPSGLGEEGESRILTAPAMFDYATTNGHSIAFTLPTQGYFADPVAGQTNREVDAFGAYRLIDRADQMIRGEYGEVEIGMFQIGNEFWYRDERQTPEEYGMIANDLSIGLQRIFNIYRSELDDPDSWVEPKIAVQVAQGWKPEDNEAILEQLTPNARSAIDVVTQHFYPTQYHAIANSRGVFNRLDDFQEAEGFGDLEYYLSEWNVSMHGNEVGLLQASGMLEVTRTFMERGVDHATLWGTQYQALRNRMAELYRDDSTPAGFGYRLTVPGELFKMMNTSLEGLQVLDIDTDPSLRDSLNRLPEDRDPDSRTQMVMHGFGSDERVVLFISSRTDEEVDVTLDPQLLIPSWDHLYGQSLGALNDPSTERDEGDPTASYARPYLQHHSAASLLDDGEISFSLGPYEIMRLEFSLEPVDLHLYGNSQVVDPDADYDEEFFGGWGNNRIEVLYGNNRLHGRWGDDTLIGGEGDDWMHGGPGDDLLIAGSGNDTLIGGQGEDTLVAGSGQTFMNGMTGLNHYIVNPEGDAIVSSFETANGDTLSFLRAYDSAEAAMAQAAVVDEDIVFTHEAGGTTTLLGAAGQFDALPDALSDFDSDSAVNDLVDQLTTPPPDGSIPDDPDDVEDDPNLLLARQFEELLNGNDLDEAIELLDGYSQEELSLLNEYINPSILMLTSRSGMLSVYLSRLDDEALDSFFDRLNPLALEYRWEDSLTPTLPLAPGLDPDVVSRLMHVLDGDAGERLIGDWNDEDVLTLVESLETIGLDYQDYEVFDNMRERIEDLLDSRDDEDPPDEPPPDEPPPDEPPPGEDEDPPPGGGGGCFVATCAYGDYDHPDVLFLRVYRDVELSAHPAGRIFIRLYYRYGPYLARLIAPYPHARSFARLALGVMVKRMRHHQSSRMLEPECQKEKPPAKR
ncbi:MAG: hypothetical protein JJT95_02340 [Pararhodobacter sp.]|nr:hypothetical protein [Pararhodobacter sp.]